MITRESGVRVAASSRKQWPGVTRIVLHLRWETEPGWIAVTFDAPALCAVLSETGGRCQIRIQPDQPALGEYFGAGHLSLIAPTQPLIIHAAEMRDARIALYLFDLDETDCPGHDQRTAIGAVGSRYMFRDERLYDCVRLLGEHREAGDPDVYGRSLARALQLSLPGASAKFGMSTRLTGERFAEVIAYINDHLDQKTTIDDIAEISKMSATQFGRSFQDATGMSLQRWQMDARIRSAQRLMVDDPNESLAAIATLVGFSDSSHFSRAFLEIVGTTPSVWLRQRS